jgi:hypothetical protein
MAYFYSATLAWFCSALDTSMLLQRMELSNGIQSKANYSQTLLMSWLKSIVDCSSKTSSSRSNQFEETQATLKISWRDRGDVMPVPTTWQFFRTDQFAGAARLQCTRRSSHTSSLEMFGGV